MKVNKVISELKALKYLAEDLDIQTPMGRRLLLDTEMICDASCLEAEFNLQEKILEALAQRESKEIIEKTKVKLLHLREIRGSVKNLKANLVLDDVELFELKSFAMIAKEIANLQEQLQNQIVSIPELSNFIQLLDPQESGIPSFYIYDDYSQDLAAARLALKQAKAGEQSEESVEALLDQAQRIEEEVRAELCDKIRIYANDLSETIQQLAHLDLLIAKADQALRLKMIRPQLTEGTTIYKGMFNPFIKKELEKKKREYQAIDMELYPSVCMITGANMAGKTVVLRTLALCQYLCQFGFYVPASSAQIALVKQILISVGDDQSELEGLSSYASEMVNVNRMVDLSKKEQNILVLIDELARTTNPVEGLAIVNAVANIFHQNQIRSVITTHYSGLKSEFRKLRVKGLDKDLGDQQITQNNINSYMDYSLVEDNTGEVPHEALRIASLLGISKEIVEGARSQLASKK